MKKMLSASEIASLKLPGLPGTSVGVRAFAEREKWEFEMRTGIGGTRRVYVLPGKYAGQDWIADPSTEVQQPFVERRKAPVVGTVAGRAAKVDTAKLEVAIRALEEWEEERGVKVQDSRRPAVIALLYDYLANAGEGADDSETLSVVLKALG